MNLEHFWYETSPFVYTAVGGALLGRADSALAVASSVLLLVAGGTVFFLRRRYALQLREQASARDVRAPQLRRAVAAKAR